MPINPDPAPAAVRCKHCDRTWEEHPTGRCPIVLTWEPSAPAAGPPREALDPHDCPWKDAIIDACVLDWILTEEHEADPRKAVNDLLCWQQKITLDPAVSKDAHDLHERIRTLEAEVERLRAVRDAAPASPLILDVEALKAHRQNKPIDDPDYCQGCGGIYRFDTSVPSVRWNAVIRAQGLPEYLCAACIIREFALRGESFTAELSGDRFSGLPIEVLVNGQATRDAALIQDENNRLRFRLAELEPREAGRPPVAPETPNELPPAPCPITRMAVLDPGTLLHWATAAVFGEKVPADVQDEPLIQAIERLRAAGRTGPPLDPREKP